MASRRVGGAAVVVAIGGLLACGGAPTSASTTLPLTEGRQLLTLSGFGVSSDVSLPPCAPVGLPRDGTSITTLVVLSAESGAWVARSSANLGTIELRLRAGESSSSGYGVTGTITGSAADAGLMGVPRDVRVTLASSTGGAATFDGATTSRSSSLIVGRVSGAVRFADSQGLSSTCPAIQWSMQPY